jgi:hypothetical protein
MSSIVPQIPLHKALGGTIMAIREILLPLVSYPVAVEEAAINKSVSVAAHLNA